VTRKNAEPARLAPPASSIRTRDGDGQRSIALAVSLVAAHSAKKGSGASRASAKTGLFADQDLSAVEQEHPDGLTAAQIVDLFAARGLRFSEATFRKYVQLGLVPRSRRIGRKGKHRGSLGVYPAKAVRRINAVRRLMDEGRTIEEIQAELLRFADVIETLEEGLTDLFHRFEAELASPRFDAKTQKSLRREVSEARRDADELLKRLDDLSHRVGRPREDRIGGTGAAGSAEDLL
jgi:DNA-binding transcriptional MerR regulator